MFIPNFVYIHITWNSYENIHIFKLDSYLWRYKQKVMSTITQVRKNTTPIRTIQNISNTTQIKENTISVLFTLNDNESLLDIHERKGIIRKPSTPKPNALESFKPRLHELIPELKNLTGEELEKILEDEDEE